MRALLYECFAGIAGDMHLGALVDVGVPASYLREQLAKLELAREFELRFDAGSKMGITGTRATVALHDGVQRPHRHLADIQGILERACLPDGAYTRALAMFRAIAEVEAKIHGTTVDRIHFHEVGATDSIVDVAGAALGLDYLAADVVYCSAVEVGSGMVRCAHGLMPVPAPATAALLAGVACRHGGVNGEATTPTGAAILKCTVDRFEPPRSFKAERIGYGVGHKDFEIPNVLRLSVGEIDASFETETNLEVQCNIDDMTPEAFQPLMDALFAAGARDVFLTPVVMKKARPGTRVSVLVDEQRLDDVLAALFAGSTTIGVRVHQVTKHMLPRQEERISTKLGVVRVKVATLPDGGERWKSEHDDVVAIASEHGLDYLTAKAIVDREVVRILES